MLVILPLSLLIPRAPSKEKTFRSGNPQPLREQEEEEHREEAADCEEALLESRAVKAQETEGLGSSLQAKRGKKYALASVVNT